MKTLIVLALILSTSAFAGNILNCKSAAGYYGNLELAQEGEQLTLTAAQGFAYEMAGELQLDETSEFVVEFDRTNCKVLRPNLIQCTPPEATIKAAGFNGQVHTIFKGLIDLNVRRTHGATIVNLTIHHDEQSASESYTFHKEQGREGCLFNL